MVEAESLMSESYIAHLEQAREDFRTFLDATSKDARVCIMHDSDADGVTAGVVLQRALERLGYTSISRLAPDRERNAWTAGNRASIKAHNPKRLFILDLGSNTEAVIEGVPTCFIDHHRPEGVPEGATLISAYTWEPIPNTSLIVWELCRELTDIDDLMWVAAIGTFSDLGERAPFEIIAESKKRYKAKYLKEATTLVNAARRAPEHNPELAARALLAHASPQALVEAETSEAAALRNAREEVKAAMNEARKAAPMFSGQVALVRINTPCQVHPLIAQSWRTRLPKFVVICANEGYLPGRINFSARTATDTNILDLFRAIKLSDGEGNFGHGHDQASGGSLPVPRWNELLDKLGFPATIHATEKGNT